MTNPPVPKEEIAMMREKLSEPMAWLFAALYLSEVWYGPWQDPHRHARLHYKARGIVVFDRILCGELDRAGVKFA